MRVLLIKTSSLGDVVHAFPALTDARQGRPEIHFDWVVEEAYADLPARHPGVEQVIPVALRRWRKNPLAALFSGEVLRFIQALRSEQYDFVIDAQGLIKSAVLTRISRGRRVGFDRASAREGLAARAYDHPLNISRSMHAIERIRRLFSLALDYRLPSSAPAFGLGNLPAEQVDGRPYLIFFHGSAWKTKLWPESCWVQLTKLAAENGYEIRFPWGNETERLRAKRIIAAAGSGMMSARVDLGTLTKEIIGAAGAVGSDTGLSHLAAAFGVPVVVLYGPTDAKLTGAVGPHCTSLASHFECSPCFHKRCTWRGEAEIDPPCFAELAPGKVWKSLSREINP